MKTKALNPDVLRGIPSDKLMIGILAYSEIGAMKDNLKGWQKAIYELKKKYPDVFKEFTFSLRFEDYYSDLVYDLHSELLFSGLIKHLNPSFEELEIISLSKEGDTEFKEYLDGIYNTKKKRKMIKHIAMAFRELTEEDILH